MSLEVNISEPEDFNCQELHSSVEEVARNKGYDDFVYKVECISGKGGNFIANVFRVMIKNTNSDEYDFIVIVKTLINTERQYLFHELHKREVNAYTEIINKYVLLQKNLEEDEKLELPDCLLVNLEKNNEVIILNDLTKQGFELDEKQAKSEFLTFAEVNLVVSELAKFHALSFIFKNIEPEKYGNIKLKFEDVIFDNDFLNKSKLRNYFSESFDMFVKLVTNKDAKNKLKRVREKLVELLQKYTKPSETNVFCHGDCWVNNMLFKYEKSNTAKVCFIDYQAMRYANPMTDFMFFIFLCTDSKFRSEYFDQIKDTYYENLKKFLNLYDIDVNSIYERENFNSDFEHFLPYGLLVAVIELRVVTMNIEEDATLNEAKLESNWDLSQIPKESDEFRYRVNDVVEEAVQNGVLDKLLAQLNN